MRGQEILARTMSLPTVRGSGSTAWQYHSRSDSHSKLACWTLLYDLLAECDPLRSAGKSGRIGFGINYEMVGPINKRLDLVLTLNPSTGRKGPPRTFASLGKELGVVLTSDEADLLTRLPDIPQDVSSASAAEVAIAIEAKACMTEHVKSLPRLHAEILATGYLARLAAPHCILVSYSMVNAAPTFLTPSGPGKVNRHSQPDDAKRVIEMIRNAVPMANKNADFGYDVVGTTVIDCRNDGSPVELVATPGLAPAINDRLHYEHMVRNVCAAFRARFKD